jgi:YjbE family integral membrane protein
MEGMFSMEWIMALGSITFLNILLSGDNAILIALACKNLPEKQKFKAMMIGGLAAVLIRVVLTLFATSLLAIPYFEFFGGLALLYIAVNLLTDHGDGDGGSDKSRSTTLSSAIKTILIADLIMSIDNILGLAGVANTVSQGQWSLIICGLLISIPIVLFGAQLFMLIIQRFSFIIYLGAGILAFTAGKMVVMDHALGVYFAPVAGFVEGILVLLVLTIGWYINRRNALAYQKENIDDK